MEDFVSYEIAVKLKEKGFNDECHAYYEPLKHCLNFSRVFGTNSLAENYNCVSAPTIEQVLKWLRNKKGIFLQMEHITQNGVGCKLIERKTGGVIASYKEDKFLYANNNPLAANTYEKCALDAIEYAIDKLI